MDTSISLTIPAGKNSQTPRNKDEQLVLSLCKDQGGCACDRTFFFTKLFRDYREFPTPKWDSAQEMICLLLMDGGLCLHLSNLRSLLFCLGKLHPRSEWWSSPHTKLGLAL